MLFGHGTKNYRIFSRNFFGMVVNTASFFFQSVRLGETFSSEKNESHQVICGLERKKFGVWQNYFQQGCRNCILRVQRNRLRIFFSKRLFFFQFFMKVGEKLWPLARRFIVQDCQKCNLYVYGLFLKKNYICGKSSLHFPSMDIGRQKKPVCLQIFLAGWSKVALYLSIGSFWGGSFLME